MKKLMLALVLMPMATLGLTDNEWTGAAGPRADGLFSWDAAGNWKRGVPDATHNVIFKTVSGFDPAVIDVGENVTVDVGTIRWSGDAKVVLTNGTIRLAGGNVIGNMPEACGIKSDLELLADGVWYNDDKWGERVRVYGAVSGVGSITVKGNQNRNVAFFDSEVSVPQVQVSAMSVTANAGTRFRGTKILVKGGFTSGSNGTSFSIPNKAGVDESHYGVFREGSSIEFAGAGGSVSYTYAPVSVEEKLSLVLNGGRAFLSVSGATVPNSYFTVTNLTRAAGTYFRLQQTVGSAVPLQAEDGQGVRIVGAQNNPAGVLGVWAYDNTCYLLRVKDASGTLYSDAFAGYVTAFPTDGGDAWKLVRQTQNETLTSNLSLYHWMDSGAGSRTTELGDYDLSVYGGITYSSWGDKTISASGTGKLVFAGEDIFIYSSGSGVLDISAPIAWVKPAGSRVQYPSLVLPATKSSGVILRARDEIRDYGNLNMGLSGLLVLEGDADREFHGELQDCVTVEQRGSGSVTFSGSGNGRSLALRALGGKVIVTSSDVNSSVLVTNGASYVLGKGVSVSRQPTIWDNSYLEGFGEIAAGLGTNQIKADAGFAPGDDTEAGCLTIRGFSPTGDVSLRCRFDETSNGLLKTSGTVAFPEAGMRMTVRLVDLTAGARCIRPAETFTLMDFSTSSKRDRFDGNHISFDIVNESPRYLDVDAAQVTLDTTAKKIFLTGVKTRRGLMLLVR